MPDVYATRTDLYKYGLPRGMLANPGRLAAEAEDSTDIFELDGHGFDTDTPLMFRAEEGGTMPAPLVEGTIYYAIRLSDSTFKVAATPGGAAINLTTDGASVIVSTALPVDEVLEFYSRFADAFLPSHMVPLEAPYPITVTALVAELAAKKLLLIAGQSSASMTEMETGARAQLERWAKGIPLRDSRATASANLAYSESSTTDPRKWGTGRTLP
jgi:hypothetical protein